MVPPYTGPWGDAWGRHCCTAIELHCYEPTPQSTSPEVGLEQQVCGSCVSFLIFPPQQLAYGPTP